MILKLLNDIVVISVQYILAYLRPIIKWFLNKTTRLTEIQRICYGQPGGAKRALSVEACLTQSQNGSIKNLLRELDEAVEHCNEQELRQLQLHATSVVTHAKRIKPRVHPDFADLFGECVLIVWSYRRLVHSVERIRSENYDAENLDHEQKLLQLWNYLMPKEPLTGRSSRQWQEIGFQGDDPKTDFRGMGLLGLENLLYFAREYREAAQHVLLHSRHPTLGYTFAIVGINLTALACRLLRTGDAKVHFYNVAHSLRQPCSLEQFHKLYCYLFFEFDRFWLESEPRSIMDFRDIYQRFEIIILEELHDKSTIFKTNLVVEQV